MRKGDIEKSLKRFLKKKVSYSLSLLIAFMITGEISLGAGITTEEIQERKSELLSKIQTEREEIKRKIAENERLIKEYSTDYIELLRKGNFYSKPLFESTQIFFPVVYEYNGKGKDRTEKEFKETIEATENYWKDKGKSNEIALEIAKKKVISGNGVVVDNEIFRETIEMGGNIKLIEPKLPTIESNISVSTSAPIVNLGIFPKTINPIIPTMSTITAPIVSIPAMPNGVNVFVRTPEAVDKVTVTTPTIPITKIQVEKNTVVVSPNILINIKNQDSIVNPNPEIPNRKIAIAEPNANPFTNFFFDSNKSAIETGNTGMTLYSGIDPITKELKKEVGEIGGNKKNERPTNILYRISPKLSNINVYVAGYDGTIAGGSDGSYQDSGSGATHHVLGTIAFHTLAHGSLTDINGFLYGRSGLLTSETWRHGQITMINTNVEVYNSDNSVFYIMPSAFQTIAKYYNPLYYLGKLSGETNIKMFGKNNNIYLSSGISGPRLIENTGKIELEGASNIVYSGISYVPNWEATGEFSSMNRAMPDKKMTSAIKLLKPVEIYGDESIALFFESKIQGNLPFSWDAWDIQRQDKEVERRASYIGIYQGEIDVRANIGTKLSIEGDSQQTLDGQLNRSTDYSSSTVDGAIGIYSRSGQRKGIIPTKHLGVPQDSTKDQNFSYLDKDPIHNLEVAKLDIRFGKYSKNGFMIISELGTVIDIGKSTTNYYVTDNSLAFSDGINGDATLEEDAATGTIIAYSTGTWKQSVHQLGSTPGTPLSKNDLSLIDLEDKPSEINIYIPLTMTAKEGIAYFSNNSGIINVTSNAMTEGTGHKSIIGFAKNNGVIDIKANIIAVDRGAATNKYQNIGGYAVDGGIVTVAGNAEINGLGAFANGANAKVYLKGTQNKIKTGVNGGLVALDGGYVEFGGGTIEHKDIIPGDHSQKLSFFADNISKINFTGATTITIYNGAVFSGDTNDYAGTVGTLAKYNGMGNVTISLQTNGINLGVFKNQNIIWNGEAGYLGHLATIPKVAAIQENGHWYNSYLEGGTMAINQNIDLDAKSVGTTKGGDTFNDIGMEREQITINSGIEITSAKGNGLVLGSNITANTNGKNNDSGYINNGQIKINGGNQAGVYVSYGHIKNNSLIETDAGNGAVGVNGSKIENTSTGKINIGTTTTINGVGIVGLATKIKADGTPDTPESYGTDNGDATTKVLEISNNGAITINGTSGVGIYAENNGASVGKERATVENTGSITVGNSGASAAVGIYGSKTIISNFGTISVGDNGIAIYATEGSKIAELGILDLGADGVGVMSDGTSDITATAVTLTSNNTGTLGKTGIFYKGTLGTESQNIGVNINASALDKGTAIYVENMDISSSGLLNIGKEGVGIFVKGNSTQTGINTGTIDLTSGKTGAVGMYTKTANIINDAAGVIEVRDSSQIGMYAEGANNKATNIGVIKLNVDGSTGIYVKSDAIAELNGNIAIIGKSSVGVFAENATANFKDNLTLANNNENKNIFVYGKDSRVEITAGKTVTIDGVAAAATPGNKTVGIYLENAGTGSRFISNATGKLNVINEAVGLYSKGNNNLDVNVTATGDKTTGVFIDSASEIKGTVTARGNAVGVYGSGGTVTVGTAGLTLNTDTAKGIGMYLTDGASAAGGIITVNNTAAGSKNIGVYYSKGTASGTVTNSSDISLAGSESIGIYAADGINLVNNSNITSTAGKSENIGLYVGGGSQLTSAGTITMNDSDSIGMYTEEGKGINSGNILMNGASSAPNKSVVGMVAEAQSGKTAAVENSGTISAGANLGMYIGGLGTSSGKNTGTITTTTGTGVYVDGAANTFAGTGGTINSNKVGIYLKNTGVNKITTGTLNIASGGVGVFGENANIDFTVDTSNSAEVVGVAAKGTSVISGNITTGQDSVGVYVLNNNVSFNGANITTGSSVAPGKSSIGILLNKALGAYTMSNVTVNAQNGVGIYLDGTAPGTHLTHNGTVNTVGGIGIYVDDGTTLTTGTTVLNINGGTGVYIKGGTANLGTGGNLTFNFLAGGGTGVFNNGGTMNLGANITVTGSGSLAATTNGSLSSSGNLSIGEGATGLMGLYDAGLTAAHSVNSSGTITAVSGGIGLAAVKGTTNPAFPVTVNNTGTINASGVSTTNIPSIGIYTNTADTVNTGNINVGNKGIGIYSAHSGILTSVQNNNMTMTGTDGIGVYIKGATNGLISNNINSTGSRNTGVVLEGTAGNINVGTIALGNESVGTFVTGAAASTIDGTITVGNGRTSKSAIGILAQNGANMTLAGTAAITTGTKGIGVYAEGAGTIVTVSNTGNISVGAEGIYMYSKDAALNFSGNITADNQIGIVADGGTINALGASAITVQNGGIGAYVKNAAPAFGATAINVQGGTSSKYSMGVYYDGVAALGAAPVITQTGSYTIGMVLNNSTGTTAGGISLGSAADNNQVGVMAKGNSNLTIAGNILVNGDKNIGVYGESSQITANGNLSVGNSSASGNKSTSSIGISLNGGSYTGAGDISVGDYSIGVFGKGMTAGSTITQGTGAQIMTVGKDGLGVYGEGTGGTITTDISNITVGTDNAIGIYAKGMNSIVTGNMSIGANTSVGIVSEGTGNVAYTGAMTIDPKASTASVGIYKILGNGIVTTSAGNWNIGNSGYGIYLQQAIITRDAAGDIISSTMTSNSAAVINNADMTLGTSSVGIYSNGANTVTNTGNIIVGATDLGPSSNHNKTDEHLNSIGIYLLGGTTATSSGTITVTHDHSVGVYGEGTGTRFTNTGTINIDNGAVGILVRDGAVAVNAAVADINLGGTLSRCGATTVGMAAYSGARIENAGTITVNEGVGMVIGVGATFTNTGTIIVNNGIGIEGVGNTVNAGHIVVNGGAAIATGSSATAQVGAVEIKPDGTIKINGNYTSIGGTLSTAGNIIVDGAYVDVTTGTPLFNANSVSGEVRLLPNFAITGNGISYEIEGFVNTAMGTITGTKLTPVTSPLFVAKVADKGSLVIVKRPYADITIGKQFDAMDKGLDNILKNSGGKGRDANILKGLNEYFEGLPSDQFERETSLKLAETRGDIYATIQGRMQDINRAFDNSFYELESSYNLTKDSSKYSIIYTDGNYKDSTLGIDDYDYKVMGLLYMKEKEGTEYGNKYGYTLGFAGSKFDFDDGGSKEDVYSLRAGVHRVKNLSDEYKVSWLSRIELGYNRHIAKRKLNLHKTYENKGEYNTYSVAFDNRLTKVIYTDLSRQLDVYADLDLEYGKVDNFKESAGSKGGLEVQIKDNDYLSAQLGAGVKASQRIYAGNDVSVKVTADVKYAYELGDNYDGNKARLKNGGEGYYSLITPEEKEGKLTGKIGLTVEKANHMGVTFEVEAADEGNRKDSSIKYGVRFNYKF